MKKITWVAKDSEGKVRAWARGPLGKEEEVERVAREHLQKYKEEKKELGDPLALDLYTWHRWEVEVK